MASEHQTATAARTPLPSQTLVGQASRRVVRDAALLAAIPLQRPRFRRRAETEVILSFVILTVTALLFARSACTFRRDPVARSPPAC